MKAILLVIVLLVSHCQAKLWFEKNEDMNPIGRPRRRLTDIPDSSRGTDTPTETVVVMEGTDEDAPPLQEDKTCDGQLVQEETLAKMEHDRDQALETIQQLQQRIQELITEQERVIEDRKTVVTTLMETRRQSDAAIRAAYDSKDGALAALTRAKDGVIARLQEHIEATQGDVDGVMRDQLVVKVQEEALARELELKNKLEEHEQETAKLLEATREEAKRVLVEQITTWKEKVKDLQEQASMDVANALETVKNLQVKGSEMMELQKAMEQELEHYRATFETRTYCNMTFIAEDLSEKTVMVWGYTKVHSMTAWRYTKEAAIVAAIKTQETVTYLAGEANVHGRRLAKDFSIHAQAGHEKSKQIFNEQYDKQWPKIKPHYDLHIAPLVEKALHWKTENIDPKWNLAKAEYTKIKTKEIDPRLEVLNKERKVLFVKMVDVYSSSCHESHRFLVEFAKQHDLQEKVALVETAMKESCHRPEHSVTLALKMLLVLSLLPFMGRILGLSWSIARFVLGIVLTVTLIRFLLPRSESRVPKVKRAPTTTSTKAHARKKKAVSAQ